ncbi:hypothetical protein [Micromonospora sp. URMC 103]|uniref:hypothetical protein n=1 Tax=Micromonospora sp. URMC 103 TaxID=3423406 RepID=UPI003F1B1002
MLSVASTRPVWRATLRSLRELTRLAVAALALTVGLNGATSVPAGAAPGAAPRLSASVLSSAPDLSRPASTRAVDRPTVDDGTAHGPGREGVPAASAATVVTTAPGATAATDPGRRAPGRRGPPLA